MSVPVALEDLPAAIRARAPAAYLVSQGAERPRVVSVTVRWSDGALVVGAGRRTAANVADRPAVTVLWPAGGVDPDHSLLVDGTATVDPTGETLTIAPSGAVLHRSRDEAGHVEPG